MKKRYGYGLWSIGLLLIFFLCWQVLSSFYRQQVIAQQVDFLQEKAAVFLNLSDNQTAALEQFADAYVQDSNSRITLLDDQGQIIFDTYDHTLHENRSDRPEVQAVLRGSAVGQSLRESDTLHEESCQRRWKLNSNLADRRTDCCFFCEKPRNQAIDLDCLSCLLFLDQPADFSHAASAESSNPNDSARRKKNDHLARSTSNHYARNP